MTSICLRVLRYAVGTTQSYTPRLTLFSRLVNERDNDLELKDLVRSARLNRDAPREYLVERRLPGIVSDSSVFRPVCVSNKSFVPGKYQLGWVGSSRKSYG